MAVGGIFSAIIVGAILGMLGRAIAKGDQGIPWWLTILTGIGAAFIGSWVNNLVGMHEPDNWIDISELLWQIGAAVVGVILVSGAWRTIKGGASAKV